MNIRENINNDIVKYMKENDKANLTTLRMAKNALQQESISKNHELSEDEVILTLKKFIKQKQDGIEEYKKYNKDDVVKDLQREIDLIKAYLPEDLSLEDINKGLGEIFADIKPESIKDMGKLMSAANEKFGASADKALVSKLIKERLQ